MSRFYYLFLICFLTTLSLTGFSQVTITNKGNIITISPGTSVYVNGSYHNLTPYSDDIATENPQIVAHNGSLFITGDIINTSTDRFNPALLVNITDMNGAFVE